MRSPTRTVVVVRDGPGSHARRTCRESVSCIRCTFPSAPGPTYVQELYEGGRK